MYVYIFYVISFEVHRNGSANFLFRALLVILLLLICCLATVMSASFYHYLN